MHRFSLGSFIRHAHEGEDKCAAFTEIEPTILDLNPSKRLQLHDRVLWHAMFPSSIDREDRSLTVLHDGQMFDNAEKTDAISSILVKTDTSLAV